MSRVERQRGLAPALVLVALATAAAPRRGALSRLLVELLGRRELNALVEELRAVLAEQLRQQIQLAVEELRCRT